MVDTHEISSLSLNRYCEQETKTIIIKVTIKA